MQRRLRCCLALAILTLAAPASAQEGGLGVTTEREEAPAEDEGGLGVDTGGEDDEHGGLGVDTGREDGGPGVDTGDGEAAGDDAAGQDVGDAAGGEAGEDEHEHEDGVDADVGDADGDGGDDDLDDEAAEPSVQWTDGRVAGWVTFGASFAVAVGGAIVLAAGADDVNTIENAPGGTDWDAVVDAYDRAPILTATGAVVLGVGVAGMAAGAILLAIHGEGGTWLEATVGPGNVGLRGRF